MDVKAKKAARPMSTLEQNTGVLAATLAVGVPNSAVRRLTRNELKDFAQNLLQPSEPKLTQVADASTISRLESFEGRSPAVQPGHGGPGFLRPERRRVRDERDTARQGQDALGHRPTTSGCSSTTSGGTRPSWG